MKGLLLLILVVLVTSCYPIQKKADVYSPTYESPAYAAFRAQQKAQNQRAYETTQSAAWQRKHSGVNPYRDPNNTGSKSVVGTSADPFLYLRNTGTIYLDIRVK